MVCALALAGAFRPKPDVTLSVTFGHYTTKKLCLICD